MAIAILHKIPPVCRQIIAALGSTSNKDIYMKRALAAFLAIAGVVFSVDILLISKWHLEIGYFLVTLVVLVKVIFILGSVLVFGNRAIGKHLVAIAFIFELALSLFVYPMDGNLYTYSLFPWFVMIYFTFYHKDILDRKNA